MGGILTIEEIIGVIREAKGHTYDTILDLYFTTQRIIVIFIQSPNDISYSLSWTTFFFGDWVSRGERKKRLEDIKNERRHQLKNTSPDELTKRNRHAQFRYEDILSAEINREIISRKYKLKFAVSDHLRGKRSVQFTIDRDQLPEAKELLTKVLKAKLTGKQLTS